MDAFTLKAILGLDSSEYEDGLDKAKRGIDGMSDKTRSFGRVGQAVFGAWMEIGRRAVNFVFSSISSNVGGAVRRLDTLNNFPKVMQSLGFSAEEAEASIDKLGSSIDHLPTTLDAVSSQTQQLVAITGDLDEATELTLALNNAMAAGGAPAEQQAAAINQWTQAMAKGKPDLQDWRALVQTAPAQMNQLAEATLGAGKTQQDLYAALQDGSVTIDEVNAKMIELSKNGGDGFASWEEQAKSAGGGIQMAMVNVRAAVQRNLANVIGSINKMLEKWGGISGVMQSVIGPINSFGDLVSKVIEGILPLDEAVTELFGSIGEKVKEFIPIGMDAISNFLDGVASMLPQIMVAGANLIMDLVEGIISGLPQMLASAVRLVAEFVEGLAQSKNSIVMRGVEIIKQLVVGLWNALPDLLLAVGELIGALLKSIWDNRSGIVEAGFELLSWIATGISSGLEWMFEQGAQIVSNLWEGIKSWAGRIVSNVRSFAQGIPTSIKRGIGSLYSVGSNVISSLWDGVKSWAGRIVSNVRSIAQSIPRTIRNSITGLYDIGSNIVSGIWNGIKGKWDSMVSWLKEKARGLPGPVKKVLGIESPSKVFAEIGKWIPEGLAKGIEDNMGVVDRVTGEMSDATIFTPGGGYSRSSVSGGNSIINYITVTSANDPEDFANRLVRQMQLDMRTI